jgi:hypothetical protein
MSQRNIMTYTATAPSYWASYITNGDASGIDGSEQAACDAWLARNNGRCIGPADYDAESEFRAWHNAWNESPLACDCIDYLFIVRE